MLMESTWATVVLIPVFMIAGVGIDFPIDPMLGPELTTHIDS
jgi:hypothetical protein